ncbi:MAG TPA: alkaline phosphatase family protein [Longimicrobium sp.]|uniref:alkaline phosphatase family protein n=1 Tax=Longimicrobium sp. TaxID=2029185 RepID=UPI002ED99F79
MTPPRRALLVFVDGVGIGEGDPEHNPFAAAPLPGITGLLGGRRPVREQLDGDGRIVSDRAVLVAADATMEVEGTPQSGTGQTALLTGRNAAAEYGRHFGPWVPTDLRPMLARENLLRRAADAGRSTAFANAYPLAGGDPRIFRRPAAPPLVAQSVGALVRGAAELFAGDAVASSITHERWTEHLGAEVPQVTAEDAARTLARIAGEAELTLFAHYDTDYSGHRGGLDAGLAAVGKLDRFLGALAEALPPDLLLVVSSDHGNLEDARGGHTRNRVPVLAMGPGREAFAGVRAITDVAPAILNALHIHPPREAEQS